MKATYSVVGLAMLGLGVASWATPARGQTGQDRVASTADARDDAGSVHVLPRRSAAPPAAFAQAPQPSPRLNDVVVTLKPSAAPASTEQPSAPAAPSAPVPNATNARQPVLDESCPSVTISSDGPDSRADSAVSIEWLGSSTIKMHQPTDFALVVRNNTAAAVQDVRAFVRVPTGLAVFAAEPRASAAGRVLEWQLGALAPRQERKLQVRLAAEATGELVAQAWATFTCAASLTLRVQEPKLVLKTRAAEQVTLGDAANIVFTVSNAGEGTAEQVKIQANLSDGLEHASGKHVEFKVGSLAPGESRTATLVCSPKTGGQHLCEACALSEAGLGAREQVTVTTTAPRLVVQATGPALRYLDRKAVYTFRVRNPGDASATNVVLDDVVPDGMKFLAATDGGQHDALSHHVSWRLGEIGAGQAREVRLELAAVAPGEHRQRVAAQSAQGQAADVEVRTRAEGVSALVAEVVDTDDPIEVGAETTYEVRLVNTGSKEDTAVALICTIPDKMEFKAAQGPCRFHVQGRNVVFDALPRLAPRGDALFRVTVRGIAPGDARFKIQVNSASLTEPLMRTESTRVYADAGQ
jgi:uncharacterized repeat protein (TIGR01451 family)